VREVHRGFGKVENSPDASYLVTSSMEASSLKAKETVLLSRSILRQDS